MYRFYVHCESHRYFYSHILRFFISTAGGNFFVHNIITLRLMEMKKSVDDGKKTSYKSPEPENLQEICLKILNKQ